MEHMYPAQVNSPIASLTNEINATTSVILVTNVHKLPPTPNIATIGLDEDAETILYTQKFADRIGGVTRGFQGTAKIWPADTPIARMFTAYDHDTVLTNVLSLDTNIGAVEGNINNINQNITSIGGSINTLNQSVENLVNITTVKDGTLIRTDGLISSILYDDNTTKTFTRDTDGNIYQIISDTEIVTIIRDSDGRITGWTRTEV